MTEWLQIGFSILAIIVIPIFIFTLRMMMRWTKVETQLERLLEDVKELVDNKERDHAAMMEQMRNDRVATDRRLRWLEEHLWKRGGGRGNAVRDT